MQYNNIVYFNPVHENLNRKKPLFKVELVQLNSKL